MENFMIVLLVIVFGAIVGFVCHEFSGSGYGLVWDIILGVIGSTTASFLMTFAYIINRFGKEDVIGLNWYCMTVTAIGALLTIYGVWLYKRSSMAI